MEPWDLKDTSSLVKRQFGREQETLFRESSRSVNDRKAFSSYHFREAMRLSKDFERRHLSGARTILELHVAGAEKKELAFNDFMVFGVQAVSSLSAGALVMGQSQEGCYDPAAPKALAARGAELGSPAQIAQRLTDRWF